MKKAISLLLCVIFLFAASVPAFALEEKQVSYEESPEDINAPLEDLPAGAAVLHEGKLDINAKSVILMESNTGQVLYESNSDQRTAPASITKVMSLLLIMEAIDEGRLDINKTVTASEHAASMGGSQIWLKPEETMTVDELLRATVIASANDATVALAEEVYGSEETFVAKMNAKAKELGLSDTNFINCTGLDAEGHYTSAHDVAVVSCELLKHKLITKYSTVWMDSLRGGKSELVNTNKLVRYYNGCTGLKTGTTGKAGCCLAASASRDGMELVAVVMGAPTSNDRFNGARKMLDYGFANWEFITVAGNLEGADRPAVKKGMSPYVKAVADGNLYLILPKGSAAKISQQVIFSKSLTAPIAKNQEIGYIKVSVDGSEAGVIKLLSAQKVKRRSVPLTFCVMLKATFRL